MKDEPKQSTLVKARMNQKKEPLVKADILANKRIRLKEVVKEGRPRRQRGKKLKVFKFRF